MQIPSLTGQFGTDLYAIPDKTTQYMCDIYYRSRGFTYLMKLVLSVAIYPEALNIIKNNLSEINAVNDRGRTALHLACCNSNTVSTIECVKLLIDANADVNIKDDDGYTALYYASIKNHNETIDILVRAGANIMETLEQVDYKYLQEIADKIMYKTKRAR